MFTGAQRLYHVDQLIDEDSRVADFRNDPMLPNHRAVRSDQSSANSAADVETDVKLV
jgi:hypothetical protein